ncbi:MAG: gliding motility-associated C-terminal domain-containing protein [Saprospiraceae bacterium]|nr:gliding motility-associated C-terminal domain-containing protein [Saprospiraceae bacterium]
MTVVDSAGCRAVDQILVLVEKRRPIFIPTAFHPGGEQNTRFYIQTGDGITEIEKMEVFNRWGERVWSNESFQPNDPAQGWDGMIRGEPANPEVFVYYAKILFDDGVTILYKGDVTLMR